MTNVMNNANEKVPDLEKMTVWEHVEFWATLSYNFLWQLQKASIGDLTGSLVVC